MLNQSVSDAPIKLATGNSSSWPQRAEILGVPISRTDYRQAVDAIIEAAKARRSTLVTALAVHGLVQARLDPAMMRAVKNFDIVAPDGQPVRHALNMLHDAGLSDRVYGPTLMLKLCERAAVENIGVFLYGSTSETVALLVKSLASRFSALRIVGAEPSVFRPLTMEESAALARRISDSGAGLLFVGLGCPRQERFAAEHQGLIPAAMICVGAAFDFHAGVKRQAPAWMQRSSLEWLFRLGQEPRRLFKRYLVTNIYFLLHVSIQLAGIRLRTLRKAYENRDRYW